MISARFAPFLRPTVRIFTIVVVVFTAILVTACSDDSTLGKAPNEHGQILSVSEALRHNNFDRTIVVQGTIALICQDEGCWMSITDGSKRLRMTFADEAFTVPISATGRVLVEGTIHEELVDAATAQAIGESIGVDSATTATEGDRRIPLMTASGVKFLD